MLLPFIKTHHDRNMPLFNKQKNIYMKNNNENLNELLNLKITLNNSVTISISKFNLSTLYKGLHDFHESHSLGNQLFFAYPFNVKGLLDKKCSISGYIDSHRPSLTSGLLTSEDMEFLFYLEHKLDNEYAYLYKYNVLNLYIQIKRAIALDLDKAMKENLSEF
jgi:hypothetical protein